MFPAGTIGSSKSKREAVSFVRNNFSQVENEARLRIMSCERICVADEPDQFREEMPFRFDIFNTSFDFDSAYRKLHVAGMCPPWEQQQTMILGRKALKQISNPLLSMDGVSVYGAQQIKPVKKLNAHSWRASYVLQSELDGNARVAVSAMSQVTDDSRLTRNPWAQR